MDTIECIRTRRSIRKFRPDPVPRKLLMELIDCARHAPCTGPQPWQFVVVTDPNQKKEIVSLKQSHPSPWAADAPVLIGIFVDISKSGRWIEAGSAAATTLLLAAHAKGLGACWVAMRYTDTAVNARIQKAFGVRDNFFPVCAVALGYPGEEPKPKQLKPLQSMVR